MTEFFNAILAFPTVVFTIPMGVVLAYWLFVIIGAAGIDMFDGHVELEGGMKAAGGALEGGAKAAGGALEGGMKAAGGALEGGAKAAAGALEGGAKASAGLHDHDAHLDGGLLAALGFASIPITVSGSLITFFSWALSLLVARSAQAALAAMIPTALISVGVGLLCFITGVVVAGVTVRPLRPIFREKKAPGRDSLMGRVCSISSGSVTDRDGHATLEDGGAGLILNVVCPKANALKRGDPALILGYDPVRHVYEVEPVDWLIPEELEQLRDPTRAAALARSRLRG